MVETRLGELELGRPRRALLLDPMAVQMARTAFMEAALVRRLGRVVVSQRGLERPKHYRHYVPLVHAALALENQPVDDNKKIRN